MPELLPLKAKVLIYRDPEATQSEGNHGAAIFLPDNRSTEDEKRSTVSVKGTVINVGPDVDDQVVPGDRVVYRWYTGDELKINGKRCVMIERNEILAREKRNGEA